ncbi:Golgi apyrase [Kickxella alabastrina]|uniref:Golgi apyrase n=1 Tax=Kickxella alabastrina TaxID=61397 RepID=A0ACC1IVW8_9FUNG|nr:Golgi apyrase [Kickxella alabastrina]
MSGLGWLQRGWLLFSTNNRASGVLPGANLSNSSGSGSNAAGGRRPTTKQRMMYLAVFAIFSLSVLGLFYFVLDAEPSPLSEQPGRAENDSTGDTRKYGVVIDAGSSGSRAMIYAWDDPSIQQKQRQRRQTSSTASDSDAAKTSQMQLPTIERAGEHWTFKTSPGISSFADRPRMVGVEHIKPLLDYAQAHIPKRQIAHTPVYLLATAGMRLLPKSHQALLMDTACTFARANYEFLLPDCQESFHVVSGELEGLYGWVAVNYLLKGFGGDTADSSRDQQPQGHYSHGFLDMGGASAQIAFEPAKVAAQLHQNDLAQVTLRSLDGSDHSFQVFVATFLGHGTNEARRRYVDQLRQRATVADGADLSAANDPCLATGLVLPTTDGSAVLRGSGDFSACVAATEPLLNKTACPIEPCLFAGVHAPEIDFGRQSFVGVSEYWYASHDYLGLGGVWDVEKFEARAAKFCQKPWAELLQLSANDPMAVARLQMQCFKAAWLVNVLHKGFGVPRAAVSADNGAAVDKLARSATPFQSVNQVGDVELSWTLGALLLRVSRTIPANYRTLRAKTVPGIQLSDSAGASANDDGVELVDDSLWSPLRFVGIRRLLILWSLQPTTTRMLLLLTVAATIAVFAGLVYWLCTHKPGKYKKVSQLPGSGNGSDIALSIIVPPVKSPSTLFPLSPSQLGIAEAAFIAAGGDDLDDELNGKELRKSPSMFVLDMLPRPFQSVLSPMSRPSSPPTIPSADHRSRSGALAAEGLSMSRSSSFNSLLLLNRRRGGGAD